MGMVTRALALDAQRCATAALRAPGFSYISGSRTAGRTSAKAAATANYTSKRLDDERYRLIVQTCDEILAGQHHDMFPLHVWMTGSGTQFNMNVYKPLLIYNLTHSITLMTDSCTNFCRFLVEGTQPTIRWRPRSDQAAVLGCRCRSFRTGVTCTFRWTRRMSNWWQFGRRAPPTST
jgi:Lyase